MEAVGNLLSYFTHSPIVDSHATFPYEFECEFVTLCSILQTTVPIVYGLQYRVS